MRLLSAILLCVLLLNGCRKSDRNNDTDITLAQDAANVQPALFEAFFATHEACLASPGIKSFLTCATLTVDTLRAPRQLTIDFGTTGCTSPAGHTRTGKIIVYQTGHYQSAGSTTQVYFDTFYLNGYNYNGSFVMGSLGGNAWKLSPKNMGITAPDSSFTYILPSGDLLLQQTGGTATVIADDDVLKVTGTLGITGHKGNTGTCTVDNSQPLVVNASCAQPVSGMLTMIASGQAPRKIDFGTGSCDNKATVTANTVKTDLNITF